MECITLRTEAFPYFIIKPIPFFSRVYYIQNKTEYKFSLSSVYCTYIMFKMPPYICINVYIYRPL